MKLRYCWRCGMDVPMLDEDEWAVVAPLLTRYSEKIKAYRQEHGVSLKVALERVSSEACEKYNEITGCSETNTNAIWHHRNTLYGMDCPTCGKPYRTPRARYCAACGHDEVSIEGPGA